ncbi:MAG: hypothetical protein ILM98_15890 [Kiritimatiellae bacterium]|nr:hypothetical protein [Kiritimatiellia bacterium]
MNTSLIKSALAMTAAFAVGSALATETVTQLYGATFESSPYGNVTNDYNYTNNVSIGTYNSLNTSKWFAGSNDDQSIITDVGAKTGDQALKLQTEGGTLTNQFFGTLLDDINDARENAKLRFEANVKFVASDTLECGVEAGGDAKFALYAYAPDGGTTNLVVVHYNGIEATNEVTDVEIDTEKYTSIVVEYRTDTSMDESYFSITVDGEPVTSDLAEDDIWFMTINSGDYLDISSLCFKGTGMVDDIAISKVEEAQQSGWVADPETIAAGTSAATQYSELASSALATADAKELTVWAAAKGIAFDDVTAAPADYLDAFLLNCTVADVADEKEEFVLNITIDENGVPVITLPAGFDYNGTLQLKGATSLTGDWTDISAPSATYKFYKYELHL